MLYKNVTYLRQLQRFKKCVRVQKNKIPHGCTCKERRKPSGKGMKWLNAAEYNRLPPCAFCIEPRLCVTICSASRYNTTHIAGRCASGHNTMHIAGCCASGHNITHIAVCCASGHNTMHIAVCCASGHYYTHCRMLCKWTILHTLQYAVQVATILHILQYAV
jgi:hypothetical protein